MTTFRDQNPDRFLEPYLAHPDGEDCFTKMWVFGKFGLKTGAFVGCLEAFMISKPKGYINFFSRVAQIGYPTAVAGFLFPALACAFTSYRKKDDHTNYMLAGGLTGAYFGCAYRKVGTALILGISGAFLGYMFKDSLVNNWSWVGEEAYDGEYLIDKTLYVNKQKS